MPNQSEGAIAMVHGMWGGPWYWEGYKEFFASRGYSCVNPELLYHGGNPNDSPHPRLGNTSVADYTDDIANQIADLPRPMIFMGHSMGGLIVLRLASFGLADAVVCLASVPPRGISLFTKKGILSHYGWRSIPYWLTGRPQRLTLGEAVYFMLNLLPPNEQKEIFRNLRWDSGRAVREIGLPFLDRSRATEVDESKINCPVLIIAGKEDNVIPVSITRKIARKITGSDYWELENHSHWIMGEPGWEKVAGDIYHWLQEKLGGVQKEKMVVV